MFVCNNLFPVTVWWILHHPLQYVKNCGVRLLSNYNIKYICTIYTRLDTCLMSISQFSLRDKVPLWLLKLYFNIADVIKWSRALDKGAKRLMLQCINGVSSNPVEGRTKLCQIKDLILTLFGLIFRRIYIYVYIYIRIYNHVYVFESVMLVSEHSIY
jgi:hypothetical protein